MTKFYFLLFVSLALTTTVFGQATYNMSNNYVEACEGTLIDSEAGEDPQVPNGYAHNENFVFTVCVPSSDGFTITFSEFFLELDYDFLTIYMGTDINAPLFGSYTGQNNPGTVIVNSDCITFHFTSDPNISAPGFSLSWDAVPPEPIPPVFNPNDYVSCESIETTITLDVDVPCSEVVIGNFQFNAPSGSSISSVTPINCTNGKTNEILLNFNSPLDESGRYWITFTVNYTDVCGYTYTFDVSTYFDIIDCPLELELLGNQLVCEGGCVTLFADAKGGNPATYVFDWNFGTIGPAVRTFCPPSDTIIYVTVSDNSPSPSASDSIILTIIPSPTASTPEDTLCRNDADIFLTATPIGGFWSEQGIVDANTGQFRPSSAPNGLNKLVYHAPNGCTDTVPIFILPINPGPTDIACINSDPFMVRGGNPNGGSWSGSDQIDAFGNYTPLGFVFTDTVIYNAPNGCSAKKLVKNVDSVNVQLPDTVCVNDAEFTLIFNPFGGVWSTSFSPNGTNGITNNRQGTFNPTIAGTGTHQLKYEVFGCYDSTSITIIDISAGIDEVYCPEQDTFRISTGIPIGGIWTGNGIVDSLTGLFDPGTNGGQNFNTTLQYALKGCSDEKIIYVYQTDINADTISFCDYESPTILGDHAVTGTPGGGVWSGTGMSPYDNIAPQQFDSAFTYIYFTANTCSDSMIVEIYPSVVAQKDTIVCPVSPDFNLKAKPLGGTWSGFGIVDVNDGTFSPDLTGEGDFFVSYSLNGCSDQVKVTVDSLDIEFSNYKNTYCFSDNPNNFTAQPTGGVWSGAGITDISNGVFVSSFAGEGTHIITYTLGSGECAVSDSITIFVRPALIATIIADTTLLCFGEKRTLTISAYGGYNLLGYEYEWSHNLPAKQAVTVSPDSTTTYYAFAKDNCSNDGVDSITVSVSQEITFEKTIGDTVCYGSLTSGIVMPDDSTFIMFWNTSPTIRTPEADSILHGRYLVTIIDTSTSCSRVVPIHLPNYPYINAYFEFNPLECLEQPLDTSVYFVDLSSGAEYGVWEFETPSGLEYQPYGSAYNTQRIYKDTGTFNIQLTIYNGGNDSCSATYVDSVCVVPPSNYLLPNAFTPNGDSHNDVFPKVVFRNGKWVPFITGATDYEMSIYDRWGRLVYACNGDSPPWNGGWNNNLSNMVPSDVYSYHMKIMFKSPLSEDRIGKVVLLK